VRRVLVEAAWHYRHPPPGPTGHSISTPRLSRGCSGLYFTRAVGSKR
jgi:hypothetical protein